MIIYHMQESIVDENEDDSNSQLDDAFIGFDHSNSIFLPEMKTIKDNQYVWEHVCCL